MMMPFIIEVFLVQRTRARSLRAQKQQACWFCARRLRAVFITKLFAWGRGRAEDMCYAILLAWLVRLKEALSSSECSPNVHFCPSRALFLPNSVSFAPIMSLLRVPIPSGRRGQTHMNHGNRRTYLIHPNLSPCVIQLSEWVKVLPGRRRGGGHHSLKKIEPLRFKFSNSGNHPSVNKVFSSPSPPPAPPPVHLHSAQPRSYLNSYTKRES